MKRLLPLLLLSLMPMVSLKAEPVTPQTAKTVADRVLQARTHQATLPEDLAEVYLFVADEAFVIVAADDCVRPVMAYGDRWVQSGDSLPAAVHEWLGAYCGEIAARRRDKVEASESTRQEWQSLTAAEPSAPLYSVVVSPLLSTTWNQSPYYNKFCPSGCVTGCVATATAQVMKYWSYPAQGTGSHSYVDGSHGTLSANFGTTTYQWSLMPNALSGSTSTAQDNAVATLMFHLGVAMEMSYGSSSSATMGSYGSLTSVCAANALKTYFGYSQSISHILKASMSDSLWCALLEAELVAARPVLYSGRDSDGGHCFVLDGSNNAGHYHFNWGWGGYCDGYYIMGSLNPSPGGIGGSYTSTYNLKNSALIGVRPASATHPDNCMVNVTLTDAVHATVSNTGAHLYGDTVSMRVNTNAGYRFCRWSDGVHYNPRAMVLDSAVNLTAIVEPINATDTLYYCNSAHSTTFGAGGTFQWGVKLTADDLQHFDSLRAVQMYVQVAGDYQLRVYRGGYSSPSTLVYTQSLSFTQSQQWVDIMLDSVIWINNTLPLWVVIYNNTIDYPAAVSTYAGHKNGSMCANGSGSNWHNLSGNYSFMLRAVFVPAAPCNDVRNELYIDTCDRYVWNGMTYTASTTDSLLTQTAGGCDSTVVLHLTLHNSKDTIIYDTAVGEYEWNGDVWNQSGVYIYHGVTAEGCDSVVSLYLVILPTEGIDEQKVGERVLLYPNPVAARLTMEGLTPGMPLVLYDLSGREVLNFVADRERCTLDVTNLNAGIYLLRIDRTLYQIEVVR